MKNLISVVSILLFISGFIFGQEKLDKMPEIKGGIAALAQNIKYPELAKENKITGIVLVKIVIDEKGNVLKANVEKGVNEDLDNAAVSAVRLTKFEPGIKDGKAVQSEVTIPIKFKLDDKKKKE